MESGKYKTKDGKSNICQECGAAFKKPAYLKQHMQSHSLERPYICTVECCEASYRRKDHLTRHLLHHQEKKFKCPIESCKVEFAHLSSLNTHVTEFHDGDTPKDECEKKHVCPKDECDKKHFCPEDECEKKHVCPVDERDKEHVCPVDECEKKHVCPVDECDKEHVCPEDECEKKHVCPEDECEKKHACPEDECDKKHGCPEEECEKKHVCPEDGCGKAFKYASQLQKHEESHFKLDSIEAQCSEPGCMKTFTNKECLKAHIQSSHRYMKCEICGENKLRKNIKRHLRLKHESGGPPKTIQCTHEGCSNVFTTTSNLRQHIKVVHLGQKPYACGFPGCGLRFGYKHVRDNHEKSGQHVYTNGDFEVADEVLRSKPRGGRKRIFPTIEMLVRKRVTPPSESDFTMDEEC